MIETFVGLMIIISVIMVLNFIGIIGYKYVGDEPPDCTTVKILVGICISLVLFIFLLVAYELGNYILHPIIQKTVIYPTL